MGKASKWFRGLLGRKKPDPSTTKPPHNKKWSLLKSFREKEPIQESRCAPAADDGHVVAVAAAAARVAEAAVAAAHAAQAVVKLTGGGRVVTTNATAGATATSTPTTAAGSGGGKCNMRAHVSERGARYESREEWAAVKIQAHFRAYLSRRALRALKALVRLQALVRGSIARKQHANKLQRLEEVFSRAQARARTGRAQIVESSLKSNQLCYPGPATPEKSEHVIRIRGRHGDNMAFWGNGSRSYSNVAGNHESVLKRLSWKNNLIDLRSWEQQEASSTRTKTRDQEKSERILEIDNGKSHAIPRSRNLFHSSHLSFGSDQCSHSFTMSKESTGHQTVLSPLSCELHATSPMKFAQDVDEEPYFTTDDSPQCFTATSNGRSAKVGGFTPTKSDGSLSCLSGYSDHPNYMSCTESSKAKMRSLSAPKQRPQYERSSSTKRCLLQGYGDSRINNQRAMQANFTSKAYPGSGRLDRLGMPLCEEAIGFSGGHWHRF